MREIKVRVMYCGSWCTIDLNKGMTEFGYNAYMECVKNGETFYQFTGLLDKNGEGLTELYEGDIISLNGELKGNIHEIQQGPTDLIIPRLGTKAWIPAYTTAVGRGFDFAE